MFKANYRNTSLILIVIPVIFIISGLITFFVRVSRDLSHNSAELFSRAAGEYLQTGVRIGKVSVRWFDRVYISDVKVYQQGSRTLLLEAPMISVNLSPSAIMRGDFNNCVQSVTVESLKANIVRNKDNTTNIDFLYKDRKKTPGKEHFGTIIYLRNSGLKYTDCAAGFSRNIINLNSRINLKTRDAFVINTKFDTDHVKELFSVIRLDTQKGKYYADVNVKSLELSAIPDFILQKSGFSQTSGHIGGYIGAGGSFTQPLRPEKLSCSIKLDRVGLSLSGIRINELSGYLQCKNTKSVLAINGKCNGIPFSVNGNGLSGRGNLLYPVIDLSLNLKNIRIAELCSGFGIRSIPADGICDLTLNARGPADKPEFKLKTRIRNGRYSGYGFDDCLLSALLSGKTLCSQLKVKLPDSSVYLQGTVDNFDLFHFNAGSMSCNMRGNLQCNNIGRYLPENPYGINARILSEYSVTGPVLRPVIKANLSSLKGMFRLDRQEIRDLEISSSVSADKEKGITFDRLIIKNFLDANIMLSANLRSPEDISGKAYVSELELSRLMRFLGKEDLDLSGNIAFVGDYRIKDRKPYLSGSCELYNLSYNTYKVDYLNCSFSAAKDLITVDNMSLLAIPAKIDFSGIIQDPATLRPTFKGDFSIQNTDALTVCKIFDYTMTTPMEGIVNGNLALNGMLDMTGKQFRFRDLSGAGSLDFNDLMIDKYPFDYLHVDALIWDNVVYFNDVDGRASVFNAIDDNKFTRITGNGLINLKDYEVKGSLLVSDVNISDFRGYYSDYVNASGICDFSVEIDGYMNRLNVDAKGEFRRVTFNGKNYSNVNLTAAMRASETVQMKFYMEKDEETLSVFADDYNIKTQNIGSAGISARNISAIELLELYSMSPFGAKDESRKFLSYLPSLTGGEINADFVVSGKTDSISGKGSLTGKNITCGSEHMQSLVVKIDLDKGVVNMPELTMEFPDIYITADAFPLLGPDRKTHTNLNIINLPVSRISNYTSVKNLEGLLTVDAQVEGSLTSPEITASLDLQHPSYSGFGIDRISAGKIVVRDDKIDLSNGLRLLIGDHSASIYGSVPWDSEKMRVDTQGPLDINFAMDRQKLSFVDEYFAHSEDQSSDGIFDSRITIQGSISKPDIEGYMTFEEGRISPVGDMVLENINGTIGFSNDHGNEPLLVTFSGLSFSDNKSKPDSCKVSDDSYIRIASLKDSEVSMNCVLDNYYLSGGNITQFGDRIRGTVNGNITVSGSLLKPYISDNGEPVTVDGLYCSLSSLSRKDAEEEKLQAEDGTSATDQLFGAPASYRLPEPRAFDPQFDVHLVADNCDIRPPMTKVTCDASASVTGSLSNPTIRAYGTVRSGRVLLHVARLRINKGSEVRFTYADHEPDTYLNASAFTDVRTTDRLGINNSYRVTVDLTGSVNNMNMQMKSDPEGLNETEILSAIGKFGISKNVLTGNSYVFNPVNVAASVGISTIMSPIEDFFVDNLGLDVFSFDYMEDEYAIVNVEKNFGKRYFISFYQNFMNNKSAGSHTGIAKWELKAGTRLFNRYKLAIGTDDSRDLKAEISFGMSF